MIHGLSQRRTFVRGGKIRIGDRTTAHNGRTIPRKLNHFRFVPQDPDLEPHWERLYGDKPTSLPIMLPSNERADIFPHEYRYWKGKNLFCRGDNREALRLGSDGTRQPLSCTDQCPFRYDPETGRKDPKKNPCKAEGTLRVLLPDLPTMHAFEITARKLSIIRLNTCLDLIEKTCGQIGFIPLTLGLVPAQISVRDAPITIYLLHLDVRASLFELARRQEQVAEKRLPPGNPLPCPPATPNELAHKTQAPPPSADQSLSRPPDAAANATAPATTSAAAPATAVQAPLRPAREASPPSQPEKPATAAATQRPPQRTQPVVAPTRPMPTAAPAPGKSDTASHPQPSHPESLRAICRRLIDTLPLPQRQALHRTLENMERPGDLKGFRAYLDGKIAPHQAA